MGSNKEVENLRYLKGGKSRTVFWQMNVCADLHRCGGRKVLPEVTGGQGSVTVAIGRFPIKDLRQGRGHLCAPQDHGLLHATDVLRHPLLQLQLSHFCAHLRSGQRKKSRSRTRLYHGK